MEDNLTAIKRANLEESSNLRHIINLCYHFVCLNVIEINIKIVWVPTRDQLLDGLTKHLQHKHFYSFKIKYYLP